MPHLFVGKFFNKSFEFIAQNACKIIRRDGGINKRLGTNPLPSNRPCMFQDCVTSFIYRDKFYFLTSFIYLYLQREYSWLLFIEKQVYICNMFYKLHDKFYILTSLIYYVTSVKIFQQVLYILLQVLIVCYNLYTKTKMFYS